MLGCMQVLAFVVYHVVTSLIIEPTALKCFNHTLDRLRTDPRITVRIGSADDIRGAYSTHHAAVRDTLQRATMAACAGL